jgi:DNA-binding transcriptional ArsR family regulator
LSQRKRRTNKGEGHGKRNSSPNEVLVKALSHPVRMRALEILSGKIASPTEISEEIDVPLSNVAYHVRVLDELGLVEVVEEEAVRGSVAHFYEAVDHPLMDNNNWNSLNPKVKNALSGHLAESLINDIADSFKTALFDKRDDRQVSRVPMRVDAQGWREIAKIHADAVQSVHKAQAAAEERLRKTDEEGVQAISGILFFEAPPCGSGE